ncbi:MAG TPA: efflux RND transporter periplasmic adaptor subunit [Candidatus Acidoferrum sp.]|jgi:RND family efflux transporter MFP subunit|nr:efflux RND transporter periplasmic adaptor subunit [Candidatus Acidoferrum sp.]
MVESQDISNRGKRERGGLGAAAAALAVAAVIAGAVGCGKTSAGGDSAAAGAMQAMPVQVQIAKSQKIPDSTEYLSLLKSRNSSIINPQVEGQITKIFVQSGDRVKPGQPLLQIDPLKQQATVSSQDAARVAQEASLNYARIQLDRQKQLFAAGVTPKQDLDNAQSTYDSAQAQLKSMEQAVTSQQVELHYYTVTAPSNGIVGDIPVRVGDRVQVTTLLTTVDQPGPVEAYIYVPADRARNLRIGLPVHLVDTAGKDLADSKITFISSQVDTDTQTVLAKATVENSRATLRIAQQVRAQLIWGTHEGTVIPVLAVTRINGEFFAFLSVQENGKTVAKQKLLHVGDTVGNDYAVQDGIKPGDHIIVSGLQFLRDGAPVMETVVDGQPAPGMGGAPGK